MAFESRWTAGTHPAPAELLLAWENELPREAAEPVLAHIQQCWECRARVERYSRGIDAYVEFRKLVLDPAVTPRPGGWLRLSARLRDAAGGAETRSEKSWRRIPRGLLLAFPAAAAAAIAIAVIVSPARLTASVVLERAMRAEAQETSAFTRRILVRCGGRTIAADEDVLRAAHIDRSRPLSARSFRAWHDSLHSKQDRVTAAAGEIRMETTTPEGPITLARLVVARSDYRPRSEHVELRDGTTIDVEPEEGALQPAAPVPSLRARKTEPPASAAGAGERDALEIEVRWALHNIGADLGEALRISPSGDKLAVTGTLDDPARRNRIAEALSAFPQVAVRLSVAASDAGAFAKAEPIAPLSPSEASASPLLASRLLKDLPDSAVRSAFVSSALGLSRDMLRNSWALRRLAERYPPKTESALPPQVRASLQQLVAAHQNALRSAAREAASVWQFYVQLDIRAAGPPTSWQAASRAALRSAQSSDHLTVRLLTAGGNDGLTAAEALDGLRQNQRQLLSSLPQERP